MNLTRIVALSPHIPKTKTILAKVIYKSSKKNNKNDETKSFGYVNLIDNSGVIKCMMFQEECKKFFSKLQNDRGYYISNFNTNYSTPQYNTLNVPFYITLTRNTTIKEFEGILNVNFQIERSFTELDKIPKMPNDRIVNVYGIIKKIHAVPNNETYQKIRRRHMEIIDDKNNLINVTLWGTFTELKIEENEVYAFVNMRINRGNYVKCLNTIEESEINEFTNNLRLNVFLKNTLHIDYKFESIDDNNLIEVLTAIEKKEEEKVIEEKFDFLFAQNAKTYEKKPKSEGNQSKRRSENSEKDEDDQGKEIKKKKIKLD